MSRKPHPQFRASHTIHGISIPGRNRRKRPHSLTVFVDLEAKRGLLAVEGKDAGVWERFAQQPRAHNGHPKAVTPVAIDMSPACCKDVRDHLGNVPRSCRTKAQIGHWRHPGRRTNSGWTGFWAFLATQEIGTPLRRSTAKHPRPHPQICRSSERYWMASET